MYIDVSPWHPVHSYSYTRVYIVYVPPLRSYSDPLTLVSLILIRLIETTLAQAIKLYQPSHHFPPSPRRAKMHNPHSSECMTSIRVVYAATFACSALAFVGSLFSAVREVICARVSADASPDLAWQRMRPRRRCTLGPVCIPSLHSAKRHVGRLRVESCLSSAARQEG